MNCFNFKSNQDIFFVKYITFEKRKAIKKELTEKLMPIAWHPKRSWNICVSEDGKKEIKPIFTEDL